MPHPAQTRRPKPHERPWGAGSVKEVRPGVWRAWRARAADATGRTQRASRTFAGEDAGTRAALWAKGDVAPAVLLLGHWLDRWLALKVPTLRPFSVRAYRRHIKHVGQVAQRPLADVTTDELQEQANGLLATYTRADVVNWRGCISSAFIAATRRGLRPDNPMAGVQLPKPIDAPVKAWSVEEVHRLVAAARGTNHETWLWLALGTGPRMGELRALRRDDIDIVERTVTISKSLNPYTDELGPTKNGKTRVVAIPDEGIPFLVALLARLPAHEQRLFKSPYRDGPYRTETYLEFVSSLCERAGVRLLTPHAARHTFATLALDRGVPLKEVSEDLGHADVAITAKIYSHVVNKRRRGAATAIGRILAGTEPTPIRQVGTQNGTRQRP